MPDNEQVDASSLGFTPGNWPEEFDRDGRTWVKGATVETGVGDVVYAEYTAKDDPTKWLVIANE